MESPEDDYAEAVVIEMMPTLKKYIALAFVKGQLHQLATDRKFLSDEAAKHEAKVTED